MHQNNREEEVEYVLGKGCREGETKKMERIKNQKDMGSKNKHPINKTK